MPTSESRYHNKQLVRTDGLRSNFGAILFEKGATGAAGPRLAIIDSDVRLEGDALAWDDLRIEPVARTTGTNAPTFEKWLDNQAGDSRGVYLYSFDDAATNAEKEIHFTMQMPHHWAGTAIYLHAHWMGNVWQELAHPIWGLEYAWVGLGDTYGDTTTIYTDGNNYAGTSIFTTVNEYKHYLSKWAAITPNTSQDEASSILIARLFRRSGDASDTYTETGNKCGLLYVDAHYQINSFGSPTEY